MSRSWKVERYSLNQQENWQHYSNATLHLHSQLNVLVEIKGRNGEVFVTLITFISNSFFFSFIIIFFVQSPIFSMIVGSNFS